MLSRWRKVSGWKQRKWRVILCKSQGGGLENWRGKMTQSKEEEALTSMHKEEAVQHFSGVAQHKGMAADEEVAIMELQVDSKWNEP